MQDNLKKIVMRVFWPLMRGWPDEGRRIVQGPHLRALLNRAARNGAGFRRVYNVGAGEGGYSPLLLGLPGVEMLIESDFSWSANVPSQADRRQLFFCASLVSIPAADQSFNLILCTEVLEHIQEDEQALDEMARVLAPGGWLLITVPTPPAVPDKAHAREGYRPSELAALLTERGFEIVDQRMCMYFFFRFVLANWHSWRWPPRIFIRTLAYLDRMLHVGPPMDLMMLARLADRPAARLRPASEILGKVRAAH